MNQSSANRSSPIPSHGTSENGGHVGATVNRSGPDINRSVASPLEDYNSNNNNNCIGDGNVSIDSSLSFTQFCKVIYEEVVHWSVDLNENSFRWLWESFCYGPFRPFQEFW